MEIRPLKHSVLVLSAFVLLGLSGIGAKPFSLNKAIEEEKALKKSQTNSTATVDNKSVDVDKLVIRPNAIKEARKKGQGGLYKHKSHHKLGDSLKAIGSKHKFLFKKPERIYTKKYNTLSNLKQTQDKKLSPLKIRKLFQIDVPLKPKIRIPKLRSKHKNQSYKREVLSNEKLQNKYVPLLRSLSMLVDNILDGKSEEHESLRDQKSAESRHSYTRDVDIAPCKCPSKSAASTDEEAVAAASANAPVAIELPPPTSAPTPTTTDHPTYGDVSRLGQDQDLPVLPPRNSTRGWRNDSGVSKRSRTPRDRSSQGHISRDHGDSKHHPRSEGHEARAENHEENSGSATRHNAGSDGTTTERGGNGDITRDRRERTHDEENEIQNDYTTTEPVTETGGDFEEYKIDDKYQADRISSKSPESYRSELRGALLKDKGSDIQEPVQSKEIRKDSVQYVPFPVANDQRFIDRNGANTGENKEVGAENEAVISINRSDPEILQNMRKNKSLVIIIDGYSVTRGKYGENRLSEKSITVHS